MAMVPELRNYPRYAELVSSGMVDEASVACSALAHYVVALENRVADGTIMPAEVTSLSAAYRAVEILAENKDPRINNIVTTEFLESINASERTWKMIIARLGPNTRAQYDKYMPRLGPYYDDG